MRANRNSHVFQPHSNLDPALNRHSSSFDNISFGTPARDEPSFSTRNPTHQSSSSSSLATTIDDQTSMSPLYNLQSLNNFPTPTNLFAPTKSPTASGLTPLPMNPFSPYIGNDFTSLSNPNKEFDIHSQDVAHQLDQIMNMSFLDFANYTPGPTHDSFSSNSPGFSASPPSDMSPFETRWGPPLNRFVWTKLDEETWCKLVEQLTDEKQVSTPLHFHFYSVDLGQI